MNIKEIDGKKLEEWTALEVADAMKKHEIILFDVRTPQEYLNSHIKGVFISPMAEIDPDFFPKNPNQKILFHCGSGVRSEKVSKRYLDAGHPEIAHMEGGMKAWMKAKLPYMEVNPDTGDMEEKNS